MKEQKEKTKDRAAGREAARAAKDAEREAARRAREAEREAAEKAREAARCAKLAEKEAAEKAKADEKAAKKAARKAEKAAKKGKPAPTAGDAPAAAPKKGRRKLVRALVLTGVILLVLAAIITAALAYAGNLLMKSDRIFPGVTVGEIPVGRLTQTEAVAALEVREWENSVGGTLNVTLPLDTGFQLDYIESGVVLTAENAAAAAFRFGRTGSVLDGLRAYAYSLRHTTDVTEGEAAIDEAYIRARLQDGIAHFRAAAADQGMKLDEKNAAITLFKGADAMSVDEEELYGRCVAALEARETELRCEPKLSSVRIPDFSELHDRLYTEPQNARYVPETDTIEPEIKGIDFDPAAAQEQWMAAPIGGSVVIPVTITEPTVTQEMMRERLFRDLLGQRSTSFWGSSDNRINNIELVAQKLDGHVIQPGETFSYNGYVGERTVAAGFKAADAYVNGQVKPEIGGGICQVSSTLYCAVLASQLEIVERTCHMFAVGYLPKGLDATVSWPGPDFKFKNNRDYPVILRASVDREETVLNIQIWGSNVDGTYAEPKSSWGKRFDREWQAKGYEVQIGWDAYAWLEIYDADGNFLEKKKLHSSYYALHDEDIEWPEIPEETPPPEVVVDPGGGSGGGGGGEDPGGGSGGGGGGEDPGGGSGGGGGEDPGSGGGSGGGGEDPIIID